MDGFLSELRAAVRLSEVVGEYVSLKKQGHRMVGLCPFHAEKSPSFSLSDEKGVYYCFGCQKGGDVIDFVKDMQGLSFPEAVGFLAFKAGLTVPAQFKGGVKGGASVGGAAKQSEVDVIFRLNRFVAQFFQEQLHAAQGQRALTYLADRGLSTETIRNNLLGYAPAGWSELTDFLTAKKAPLAVAEKVGLIRKKNAPGPDGRQHFDLFRDRVMFPIIDRRGRVVGFGGRRLGDGEGPKYLNSPESEVFQKKEHFYGMFQAQKHIRTQDRACVVEGYMDCLALHQAGIGEAIATLGTAMTDTHIRRLTQLTGNVVMLFDGDAAGQAAQLKAMESFLDQGIVVRGLTLPEGMDPDDYVRSKGADVLRQGLEGAPFLLDQQISAVKSQCGPSPQARAKALDTLLPWIKKLRTDGEKIVRLQDLSDFVGVPFERLQSQVGLNAGGRGPVVARGMATTRPGGAKQSGNQSLDRRFLEFLLGAGADAWVITKNHVGSEAEAEKLASLLLEPSVREAAMAAIFRLKTGKLVDVSLLDDVTSPDARTLLNRVMASVGERENIGVNEKAKQEFADLLVKLQRRSQEQQKDQLRVAIQQAELSQNQTELNRLLVEFNRLTKKFERAKEFE
jgi:DNA primase